MKKFEQESFCLFFCLSFLCVAASHNFAIISNIVCIFLLSKAYKSHYNPGNPGHFPLVDKTHPLPKLSMENLGPVHTFSIHSTTLPFFDLEYSGNPNISFAFLIHGLSFGAKL